MGLSISQSQSQKAEEQKLVKNFLEEEVMNKKNVQASNSKMVQQANIKDPKNSDIQDTKTSLIINHIKYDNKLEKKEQINKQKTVREDIQNSSQFSGKNDGKLNKQGQNNIQFPAKRTSKLKRQSTLSVDIDKFDWNIPREEDIEKHKILHENSVTTLIKLAQYNNQSQKKKSRHLKTRRDIMHQKITNEQNNNETCSPCNDSNSTPGDTFQLLNLNTCKNPIS